ncbi:MAG: hypothetical protein ABFS17_00305 [Chloroflexota bacterium]
MTDNLEKDNKNDKFSEWITWDDNWAVGIALILVGGLYLLHTFDIIRLVVGNWWAVFILIPGLNMMLKGFRDFRNTGSRSARNTGFWGMILILAAFSFFIGISWNYLFPIFLIGIGIFILLSK